MRLSEERRSTYIELILLKLLDLEVENGGKEFPVQLPSELAPLQPYLQNLRFKGLIEAHAKPRKMLSFLKGQPKEEMYRLTPAGIDHIGRHIDEAEGYVSEFEGEELADILAEAKARRLDPIRVRFLWGWFEGEFDDLVVFQERRNLDEVQDLWAYYLTSDEFFEEVLSDLEEE